MEILQLCFSPLFASVRMFFSYIIVVCICSLNVYLSSITKFKHFLPNLYALQH